ncbi:phosphatase PAP2 family protein [Kitasatospora atroaurantiaca]|uniref:Undecaprenyl-diphosphatase n=1 Tax=Kitasatospora atroaurantiaca TaxID=285545 RepID=A0A561EW02_9ACTN|nr:phosphatase PAP2 family protein [Kitasatospora atroaurantiaca]TWE19782.1 undecaprenyl-diphosphatase [Kitasatospora atroaurantiaca]
MPLTLLAVLAAISWQVAVDGPLLRLDVAVRHGVHDLRHWLHSTLLNHLGKALSDLGESTLAIPALLGAAALAAWRHRRTGGPRWWLPLPVAALAALVIPLLVVPAKAAFARPGPYGVPLAADQWGWYPSGHTATSAIAYGTTALLVGRTLTGPARRRLHAGTALICGGVGFGLVWSDYHWLLDVLASWCLAGVVLWALARAVTRR